MTTGKSKADFPGSFIPFDRAVGPVPTVAIDASPTVQLCVNEEWLPFIVTSLKSLSRPETWDDTYDNSVIAASEVAALIGNIQDGCGVTFPPKMCVSGSFLDLDYGFVPTPGSPCDATWLLGSGWIMCGDATPQGFLQVKREFGVETIINSVYLKFTMVSPYLCDFDVQLYDSGTFTSIYSATAIGGPNVIIDVGGLTEPASAIFIFVTETFGGDAADVHLEDWKLCFTGAFPMSDTTPQWSIVFDFTTGALGWTPVTGATGHVYANHSGVGWDDNGAPPGSAFAQLQIKKFFTIGADTHIIGVDAFITCADNTDLQDSTSPVTSVPSGTNQHAVYFPDNPLSDSQYGSGYLRCIITDHDLSVYNSILLSKLIIRGYGTQPT